MKKLTSTIILSCIISAASVFAQTIEFHKNNLLPNKVYMSIQNVKSDKVLSVQKDSTVKESDEPSFVKVKTVDFKDGIIEVKVLSRLLKNAPDYARGFIGVAFRIDNQNSKFEGIYLRPTNGHSENQLMRNHSVQYFSYPDYKFDKLRKEAAGEYESYADIGLDEWITMRIEVKGKRAKLFLNDSRQPSLIVNDLKHGDDVSGAIGLWVDIGTDGLFKDLKIRKN